MRRTTALWRAHTAVVRGPAPRRSTGSRRTAPSSRLQRRFSWLDDRDIALPSLVLELDVLDRDRIGVCVQIRQRLVFGDPASEDLVGDCDLAGFIHHIDDEVLAEVL